MTPQRTCSRLAARFLSGDLDPVVAPAPTHARLFQPGCFRLLHGPLDPSVSISVAMATKSSAILTSSAAMLVSVARCAESKTDVRLATQVRGIKHGCRAAAWRVKGDARRGVRHARDRRSSGRRGKSGCRDHRAGATMKSRRRRCHAPIQPAAPHRHRSARARRCTSRRCAWE